MGVFAFFERAVSNLAQQAGVLGKGGQPHQHGVYVSFVRWPQQVEATL